MEPSFWPECMQANLLHCTEPVVAAKTPEVDAREERVIAMTMVWDEQKVVVRILGDASDEGFDAAQYEGYEILSLTPEQMADPVEMERFSDRVTIALGFQLPEKTESWRRKNRELHRMLMDPYGPFGVR